MTPKEKAQELIRKFSPLVTTWDCYWDKPLHEGDNANTLLNAVTPRQKFVIEMQSIISKIDAIDKETEWRPTEPQWWLEMMDIRKKAFDVVQKFKA